MSAVFNDKVGGNAIGDSTSNGKRAAFGDGHLVVGAKGQRAKVSGTFGKANHVRCRGFAAVVVGLHGKHVGSIVVHGGVIGDLVNPRCDASSILIKVIGVSAVGEVGANEVGYVSILHEPSPSTCVPVIPSPIIVSMIVAT